jgi:hypothetical protein
MSKSINFAHLNHGGINFVVFDADASSGTQQRRSQLLSELTSEARRLGLRVDKAALAYRKGSGVEFWGTPDLVGFLAKTGVPRWTHTLTV